MEYGKLQAQVKRDRIITNGFWTFFFDHKEMLLSHLWSREYKMLVAFRAGFELACQEGKRK